MDDDSVSPQEAPAQHIAEPDAQEVTAKPKTPNPPLRRTVPAAERKAQAIRRLQMSYRMHLARHQYRRKRKLQVFAVETRAAVVIQCLVRKKEAEARVARKRALAHFSKFMSNLRPSLKGSGLSEDEMLAFAAIKVQAAWRRRQAYFARVRAKNRKGFYNLIKQRRQGQPISETEIEDLAATFIQSKYRARRGYFEGIRRREEMRRTRRHRAAVKIQSWFRGLNTRGRLKREANARKMKRLAGFFSNVCFMKCFLIWERFKSQQMHMKFVLGKVMVRLTKRGMYMGFLMMRYYVEAKKEKRVALNKAAAHLFGSKDHARDEAFFAWKDLLTMDEETNRKVAEKLGKFLGMGTAAMRQRCFECWQELAAKKRKALWKWKNSVLVRAWHEYKEIVAVTRSNNTLLDRVRHRWMNWSLVVGLARWRLAVEDRRWARHVIVHAVWRFSMRELAMPFDAMLEHAQLSKKERAIKERFARRFKLRTCHIMMLEWHQLAAEEARRRDVIAKARFRIQNQAVVGCMSEWKGVVHDRKIEQRAALAQGSAALMRWIKRPMVEAFHGWVELIHTLKVQREKTRKLMWRIKNAAVVSTWEAWHEWLVALAMKRREALGDAVRAALIAGSLMSLLQMARSQPKAYREMLHEVMEEHFASEGDLVANMAATGAAGERRGGAKAAAKKTGPSHASASHAQVAYTKEALRAMWEQNLDETVDGPLGEDAQARSGLTSPRSSRSMSPLDVASLPPAQYVLPPESRQGTVPHSPGQSQAAVDIIAEHAVFIDSQPLHDLSMAARARADRPSLLRIEDRSARSRPRDAAERDPRMGKSSKLQGRSNLTAAKKEQRSQRRRLQPPAGPEPVPSATIRQILPAYLQAAQGGEGAGRSYGRAAAVGARKGTSLGGGRHRVEEIEGVLRESVDDLEALGMGGGGNLNDEGRPHSEGSPKVGGLGQGGEGVALSGTWAPGGMGPMPVMVDDWEGGNQAVAFRSGGKTMAEVSASIEMFEKKAKAASMRQQPAKAPKKVVWAGGSRSLPPGSVPAAALPPRRGREQPAEIPMPVLDSDEEEAEPAQGGRGGGEDPRDRPVTKLPAIVQKGELVHVSAEEAWGGSVIDERREGDGSEGGLRLAGPDSEGQGVELPALQTQQSVF